jgi:hypothetical protein
MLDLLVDLFQRGQISNLQDGKLAQIETERYQDANAYRLEDRIAELEQRHEQLKLVTLALWALLRDHSGLKESELRRYVEQIDLLDGTRDGKVARKEQTSTCSGCKRVVMGTAKVCVYCGAAVQRQNMFSGT